MKSKILIISILGALAVAFGALGAHALKEILTEVELQSFNTATKYHLIHSVYLLGLFALSDKLKVNVSFYLAVIGILFFSGSIYLLVLDQTFGFDLSFLGPITPIGGLLLISSWISLGVINLRKFK